LWFANSAKRTRDRETPNYTRQICARSFLIDAPKRLYSCGFSRICPGEHGVLEIRQENVKSTEAGVLFSDYCLGCYRYRLKPISNAISEFWV
jgi:hypothetical protein